MAILIMAAFFRLYRISEYMNFLGDEGRDAIVWLRIIREGKFTLIGPMTSIGNMYLGPLYYYLMLPFFIIFGNSPVGPSVGVAVISILTTFLLWKTGRVWFNSRAGLVAAFFYAISPTVIQYSRSSWNPNVMPFFTLVTIWGVWEIWQKRKWMWFLMIGISLSFAIQSHYLGLLLIPTVIIFWTLTLKKLPKKNLKIFLFFSFIGLISFVLLTVTPLVWFDLRHDFLNLRSFEKFFSDRQGTVNFKIYKAIPNLWPMWQELITKVLSGRETKLGLITPLILFFGVFYSLIKSKTGERNPLLLIFVWISIGLIGLGVYKQHIYDHYYGFLFPALFLILGLAFDKIFQVKKIGIFLFILFFLGLTYINLKNNPIIYPPNNQFVKVQEVDIRIIEEAKNEPYNFALISKQNYEDGYIYFLKNWHKDPLMIDPQKYEQTLASQLFVVCEDSVCEPIGHPKAEITSFGWSKIESQWQVGGVRLFKLVHNYPL